MVPAPIVVVLDANVLLPFLLRDTLLRAAAAGFYQLRWSDEILDEMSRNLAGTGTMSAANASRLRAIMVRECFPRPWSRTTRRLSQRWGTTRRIGTSPAAAAKAGAQVIVTSNLKDFENLPDGVEAQSPDEFLSNLLDLQPAGVVELLRERAADLVKPPMSFDELLDRLARVVPEFIAAVRADAADGDDAD